jgi:signal peptidase I
MNLKIIVPSVVFVSISFWMLAEPMVIRGIGEEKGNCMEPAFKDGQRYYVNKVSKYFIPYEIGDAIVYEHENKSWISRVVALSNDTIKIEDQKIIVNGVPLKNEGIEISWPGWEYGTYAINKEFKVPDGSVFVLSDKLSAQHDDSRVFGPIDKSKIKGKMWKK